METIKTITIDENTRLVIGFDEALYSPRDCADTKLCIMKHRRYNFPNEFDHDRDNDEDLQTLYPNYYIFGVDMYEHGGIVFSLAGSGTQCNFDTSSDCWFIAVPKGNIPQNEIDVVGEFTRWEAEEIARRELKLYNQYLNWEVYAGIIQKKETRTNTKGETREDRDTVDSCGEFYEIKDVEDRAKTEYKME